MREPIGFNPFEDAFVGVRVENQVAVVSILCSSIRERQASVLQQTLTELSDRHAGRVLLDLCGVTAVSTACFADLLLLQDRCKELGGKFVIFGLVAELSASLQSTGVLKKLNVAADEATARKLLNARHSKPGLMGNLLRRKAA